MSIEFQKEYREKAKNLIENSDKELYRELEGFADQMEYILIQANELDNIQADKFQDIPNSSDEWKEYEDIINKIEEKYKEAEVLQIKIDKILNGMPEGKIDDKLKSKLNNLIKNIAAKYPSKN
jgi:hypothetical protein